MSFLSKNGLIAGWACLFSIKRGLAGTRPLSHQTCFSYFYHLSKAQHEILTVLVHCPSLPTLLPMPWRDNEWLAPADQACCAVLPHHRLFTHGQIQAHADQSGARRFAARIRVTPACHPMSNSMGNGVGPFLGTCVCAHRYCSKYLGKQ